jgi:TonB family protein
MKKQLYIAGPVVLIIAAAGFLGIRYHRLSQVYVGPKVKTQSLELPQAIEVATPTRLVVAAHIDEHGRVIEDSIVQSSGDSLIDKHALETAALQVFEPATRGGKAVDVWVDIPMKYHSKESADSCQLFKGK